MSCCGIARADWKGERVQSRPLYFEWLQRYLRSKNVRDHEIWRLVRWRIWANGHPRMAAAASRAKQFAKRLLS
jgi:hypothetical protein